MEGFNHFGEIADKLVPALAEVVDETAHYVQQTAQGNAPVRTGKLRDSITVQPGDSELTKLVAVGVPYGPYVEFGTRFMPAEPYLFPAVETGADFMDSALGQVEGRLA